MARCKKKKKIRRVFGTAERPRLSVTRSLRGMYAQFINDDEGITLLGVSTFAKDAKKQLNGKTNLASAKLFGELLGKKALAAGIKQIVFDRGFLRYHGKIKVLADTLRSAGISF